MAKRPMISTYEPNESGVEQLIHREMNDKEFAAHQAMTKEWESRPQSEHPLIEQVKAMSVQERKQLLTLLGL